MLDLSFLWSVPLGPSSCPSLGERRRLEIVKKILIFEAVDPSGFPGKLGCSELLPSLRFDAGEDCVLHPACWLHQQRQPPLHPAWPGLALCALALLCDRCGGLHGLHKPSSAASGREPRVSVAGNGPGFMSLVAELLIWVVGLSFNVGILQEGGGAAWELCFSCS